MVVVFNKFATFVSVLEIHYYDVFALSFHIVYS